MANRRHAQNAAPSAATPKSLNKVSASDLAMVQKAQGGVVNAQQQLSRAEAARGFALELIRDRYGLLPGDHVGEDGTITRAPLAPTSSGKPPAKVPRKSGKT